MFRDLEGQLQHCDRSIVRNLAEKGVEREIIKWIADLLSNRMLVAKIGERLTQGLQRGEFSPLPLFNNVMS